MATFLSHAERGQPGVNLNAPPRLETKSPIDSIIRAYEDRSDIVSVSGSLASVVKTATEPGDRGCFVTDPIEVAMRKNNTDNGTGELPRHQARQLLRHNSKPWLMNRMTSRRPSEKSFRDSTSTFSARDNEPRVQAARRCNISSPDSRWRAGSLTRDYHDSPVSHQEIKTAHIERKEQVPLDSGHGIYRLRCRTDGNLRQHSFKDSYHDSRYPPVPSSVIEFNFPQINRTSSAASHVRLPASKHGLSTPSFSPPGSRTGSNLNREMITPIRSTLVAPEFWDYSEGYMDLVDMYADKPSPRQDCASLTPRGSPRGCSVRDQRQEKRQNGCWETTPQEERSFDLVKGSHEVESPKPMASPQAIQRKLSVWNRNPPTKDLIQSHNKKMMAGSTHDAGLDYSDVEARFRPQRIPEAVPARKGDSRVSPLPGLGTHQEKSGGDMDILQEELSSCLLANGVGSAVAAYPESCDRSGQLVKSSKSSHCLYTRESLAPNCPVSKGNIGAWNHSRRTILPREQDRCCSPTHASLPRPDSETIPARARLLSTSFASPSSTPRPSPSTQSSRRSGACGTLKYSNDDAEGLVSMSQIQRDKVNGPVATVVSGEHTEDGSERSLSAINQAYTWAETPTAWGTGHNNPAMCAWLAEPIEGATTSTRHLIGDGVQRSRNTRCDGSREIRSQQTFVISQPNDMMCIVPDILITPPTPKVMKRSDALQEDKAAGRIATKKRKLHGWRRHLRPRLKNSLDSMRGIHPGTKDKLCHDSVGDALSKAAKKAARSESKCKMLNKIKSCLLD